MKIFIAVYRAGSVTRAAETLYMTQPAVTRAIQELERHYGTRLFDRINHRLSVTEAGRQFYAYALHIVDSFAQLEQRLGNWDEAGVLCIGASVTVGNFLLPQVLAAFKERHGELRVRATISNGQTLQDALLDNRLDFAVIEESVSHEHLCCACIGHDRLVPVLPPDSPYRDGAPPLAALAQLPLLLREPGSASRTFLEHVFAAHGLHAAPVLESVSTQALVQAVHRGLGVSFLPQRLVSPGIEGGLVATCRVADEDFVRGNHLVWHRHKFLTAPAKEAMALFRALAARM